MFTTSLHIIIIVRVYCPIHVHVSIVHFDEVSAPVPVTWEYEKSITLIIFVGFIKKVEAKQTSM